VIGDRGSACWMSYLGHICDGVAMDTSVVVEDRADNPQDLPVICLEQSAMSDTIPAAVKQGIADK
jgi:hypothetical protein